MKKVRTVREINSIPMPPRQMLSRKYIAKLKSDLAGTKSGKERERLSMVISLLEGFRLALTVGSGSHRSSVVQRPSDVARTSQRATSFARHSR